MQSTIYNDLLAVDLQRLALKGLLTKTALDPNEVDYVLCGTVIQETKTSNIAREASMGAGIPLSVPSHTVTQACISSSAAICDGAEKILSGQAEVVIAGGVETFSDVPIRFSRKVRQKLIGAPKAMKKVSAMLIFSLLLAASAQHTQTLTRLFFSGPHPRSHVSPQGPQGQRPRSRGPRHCQLHHGRGHGRLL